MPNCKPGDLVIVIRSRYPANVGKIGRVLRRSDAASYDAVVAWEVECLTGLFTGELDAGERSGSIVQSRTAHGPDSWLLPIRDRRPDVTLDETLELNEREPAFA